MSILADAVEGPDEQRAGHFRGYGGAAVLPARTIRRAGLSVHEHGKRVLPSAGPGAAQLSTQWTRDGEPSKSVYASGDAQSGLAQCRATVAGRRWQDAPDEPAVGPRSPLFVDGLCHRLLA